MIHFIELTKRYGQTMALDRLSLEVPAGAVFGLLGPNGAGKTTLLRLVMGFIFPDAGQVDLGGLQPSRIGYLPERAFYPSRLAVRDYLIIVGRLAGVPGNRLRRAVAELLAQFGLADVADRRLGTCSRGMLQRLGLAQALVGDPPLLLLDEPALGLDPASQKFMREQIDALNQAGKTVVLSSHHLDEVSRVCTHVAVINEGRLERTGSLDTILAPHPLVTIITGPVPAETVSHLRALAPGVVISGNQLTLAGEAAAQKAAALSLLLDAGVDIRHLTEQHTTLEDVYLEATGG